MTWFDVAVLGIAVLFTVIGFCTGFLRNVMRFGASVFAVIFANFFGGYIGRVLFPNLIKSDSAIAQRLPAPIVQSINETIAKTIGIAILFLILFVIFKIISGFISKLLKGIKLIGAVDKILGALFGLLIAVGVIFVFAHTFNIIATLISFVDPSAAIYDTVDNSLIFKYFF